jgi:precorrin-3B synthase
VTGALRKGWCPGARRPMLSGDGLIVRIRPPGGRFALSATVAIAQAAAQYGNGLIDSTRRASWQIRGVSEENYPALIARLDAHGLLDPDDGSEAARNIVVDPLMGLRDGCEDAATALAGLEAGLLALHESGLPVSLPAKFGFALDTAKAPILTDVPADIRIERADNDRLIVVPDGVPSGICVEADDAADVALALALRFIEDPRVISGAFRRMRPWLAEQDVAELLASFGRPVAARAAPGAPIPPGSLAGGHGFCIGWPFGQIDAAELLRLLERAEAQGCAEIRPTPWRSMVLPGIAPSFSDRIGDLGFVLEPTDPRMAIDVCVGKPSCSSGEMPTRALAGRLAALLARHDAPAGIHVSGCAKGCARSTPAAITLVGRDGFYDLVRNGKAGDLPAMARLDADAIVDRVRTVLQETS